MRLQKLTRAEGRDSPYLPTPLNVEIAVAYALRSVEHAERCGNLPSWTDRAELQEAVIQAVLGARDRYNVGDPARASFFTYCKSRVDFAMLLNRRDQWRRHRRIPLAERSYYWNAREGSDGSGDPSGTVLEELSAGGGRGEPAPDSSEDMAEYVLATLEQSELVQLICGVAREILTPKQCSIVVLLQLCEWTTREVAELFGNHPNAIRQAYRASVRKLRAHPTIRERMAELSDALEAPACPEDE